jgi:hypothetical protein
VSLLSRNKLDIVLCPERIAVLHTERKLTLRGYQGDIRAERIIACETAADTGMLWHNAIQTLKMTLPSLAQRNMAVNVILSNHFIHYLLVPWLDKMSDEDELVFARHCFTESYGSAAESWSVRISPGKPGVAALASAVDTRLLEELHGLLNGMGVHIKSIQPHLMVAFNSCRASLEGRSAWIALLEADNLCLAALHKGQLVWIRKLRIGDAWQEELPAILEREAYLVDAEVASHEVLLWAPHLVDMDIPAGGRWKIRHLKPDMKPEREPEHGLLHTLALEH